MGRLIDPTPSRARSGPGGPSWSRSFTCEDPTGTLQPLAEIAQLAHAHGALLVADCVVTLGGGEVAVDRWDIDVAIAGARSV